MADDTNTAARAGAYDMIDRFLRNNLSSDEDYAEYSKALDLVFGASLAASAVEGSAPAAPPMDGEIALIEKAVKRVGIKSLLNHGAGSLVYSEGVEGVTQDDLLAYTREIALHCAVALGSTPGKMAGWRPIATAPEGQMVVVGWLDPEDHETPERHDFDLLEDGCWQKWHDHAEHVEVIGGHGVSYTPPYTCWLPVQPLPASEAKEL